MEEKCRSLKNKWFYQLGIAQIPIMVGLLIMAVALPAATKLVQQNQNTQNLAACTTGGGGCGNPECCRSWEKYENGCCKSTSGCANHSDCANGKLCVGGVCQDAPKPSCDQCSGSGTRCDGLTFKYCDGACWREDPGRNGQCAPTPTPTTPQPTKIVTATPVPVKDECVFGPSSCEALGRYPAATNCCPAGAPAVCCAGPIPTGTAANTCSENGVVTNVGSLYCSGGFLKMCERTTTGTKWGTPVACAGGKCLDQRTCSLNTCKGQCLGTEPPASDGLVLDSTQKCDYGYKCYVTPGHQDCAAGYPYLSTQCVNGDSVRTCGVNGSWGTTQKCASGMICPNGERQCKPVATATPAPNCLPVGASIVGAPYGCCPGLSVDSNNKCSSVAPTPGISCINKGGTCKSTCSSSESALSDSGICNTGLKCCKPIPTSTPSSNLEGKYCTTYGQYRCEGTKSLYCPVVSGADAQRWSATECGGIGCDSGTGKCVTPTSAPLPTIVPNSDCTQMQWYQYRCSGSDSYRCSQIGALYQWRLDKSCGTAGCNSTNGMCIVPTPAPAVDDPRCGGKRGAVCYQGKSLFCVYEYNVPGASGGILKVNTEEVCAVGCDTATGSCVNDGLACPWESVTECHNKRNGDSCALAFSNKTGVCVKGNGGNCSCVDASLTPTPKPGCMADGSRCYGAGGSPSCDSCCNGSWHKAAGTMYEYYCGYLPDAPTSGNCSSYLTIGGASYLECSNQPIGATGSCPFGNSCQVFSVQNGYNRCVCKPIAPTPTVAPTYQCDTTSGEARCIQATVPNGGKYTSLQMCQSNCKMPTVTPTPDPRDMCGLWRSDTCSSGSCPSGQTCVNRHPQGSNCLCLANTPTPNVPKTYNCDTATGVAKCVEATVPNGGKYTVLAQCQSNCKMPTVTPTPDPRDMCGLWRSDTCSSGSCPSGQTCVNRHPQGMACSCVNGTTITPTITRTPTSVPTVPANCTRKDITGAINSACCCSNTDCPSGQQCNIGNGYCASGLSCNPSSTGKVKNKCIYDASQGKNICSKQPVFPGESETDECNSNQMCAAITTPIIPTPVVTTVPTKTPTSGPGGPTTQPTTPPSSSCTYNSLQVRVQANSNDPWKSSMTVALGDTVNVGCMHDNSGQLATEATITISGPNNYSENVGVLLTNWKPTQAGVYTMKCKSNRSQCNLTSDTASLTVASSCHECPREFSCYSNGTSYKWFAQGYAQTGYQKLANNTECTSRNITSPSFRGKAKGDANCDGFTDGADYSIWRKEYVDQVKTNNIWEADFDCKNGVDPADYSNWRRNYLDFTN